MSGKWVRRQVNEHQCELPRYVLGTVNIVQPGDIWKCDDCDKQWIVTSIQGHQLDRGPHYSFAEADISERIHE